MMLATKNISIAFDGKSLFENVNLKFLPGECYGLIGANGAGKSTFLKILSGKLEPTAGHIELDSSKTISFLTQDQFAYDKYTVLETVLIGHKKLYPLWKERNELYSKDEMTDAEGARIGDLEEEFAELDGYVAEADAASMLADLGITEDLHEKQMKDLEAHQKIRILLAQALFGNPDVLLLDEPTNQLDYMSVLWLEKFLLDFKNIVIVVSHDRHFLNKVTTHTADVDFGEIKLYPGNYDFWKQASELAQKQLQDKNKKDVNKIKELEDFVRRFSANASKSKQATSRKKLIDKLTPEDLPISKRRSPFINFKPKRECGTSIVTVENVSHSVDGEKVLDNVSFTLEKGDKVAIAGRNSTSKTTLLQILAGEVKPDTGSIKWGESISFSYFPKDNSEFFQNDISLIDWLSQFDDEGEIQEVRGYLGRMLFSGEDAEKKVTVLSGGEKARAMFSRMMIQEPNTLIFDEPTDHLDLESISSLNDGLSQYSECLIFSSHDFELLNSVANRVIEVTPNGMIDRTDSFDSYMQSEAIQSQREKLY